MAFTIRGSPTDTSPRVSRSGSPRDLEASARPQPWRSWVAVLLAVVLISTPLILASTSVGAPTRIGLAPTLAVIAWSSLRLVATVHSPRPRLMYLGFHIYTYLFLGLAPLLQIANSAFPRPTDFPSGSYVTTQVLVLVGVAAFEIGYAALPSRRVLRSTARQFEWRHVYSLAAAGAIAIPLLVPRLGGFHIFFESQQALQAATQALQPQGFVGAQAIYSTILSLPPLLGVLAWVLLYKRDKTRTPARFAVLAVLMLENAIVNNPISQQRSWFGMCFFAILLCLSLSPKRRGPSIAVTSSIVLLIIFVFPQADIFRYSNPNSNRHVAVSTQFETGDFDSFQQIAVGVAYVASRGYSDGKQALGPLLFWLPRSIWPNKPIDTGVLLGQWAGYPYTNLSAPLWIESYINGGYAVVILAFLCLGGFWRRLDMAYADREATSADPLLAIVPMLALYQLALLRGSLLAVTGRTVLLFLAPLLVARRVPPGQGPLYDQ